MMAPRSNHILLPADPMRCLSSHSVVFFQNTNVPQKYKDNRKLGRWVNKQRKKKKNPAKYGALTKEQIADLDSLGFVWNH